MDDPWSRLDLRSEAELYMALKDLLQRVVKYNVEGSLQQSVTKEQLLKLIGLLQARHASQVHMLCVALVAQMVSCPALLAVMLQSHLIQHLVDMYLREDITLDPLTIEGQLQCKLFEHLSSLILYMSAANDETKSALLTEATIENLLNFVNPSSPLYEYAQDAGAELERLIEGKQLRGVARLLEGAEWQDCEARQRAHLRQHHAHAHRTPHSSFYALELYDARGESVNQQLVRRGAVLAAPHTQQDDSSDASVEVTCMLSGGYVWARLGRNSAREIAQSIEAQPESCRHFLTAQPQPGELACAHVPELGCVRVHVLSAGNTHAWVHALDSGHVTRVSWRELYGAPEDTRDLPPQCNLCRLGGIAPAPVSSHIIKYCLAALCNLANLEEAEAAFSAGRRLEKLVRLAGALRGRAEQDRAFSLLSNLARLSPQLQARLGSLHALQPAIEALREAAECPRDSESVIVAASALVACLIAHCPDNQDLLNQLQGMRALVPLVADMVPRTARDAALTALRCCVTQGPPLSARPVTPARVVIREPQTLTRRSGDARSGSRGRAALYQRAQQDSGTESEEESAVQHHRSRSRTRHAAQTRHHARSTSGTRRSRSGSFMRAASLPRLDGNEDKCSTPSADINDIPSGEIELVNNAELGPSEQFYVRGERMECVTDDTHELSTVPTVPQIKFSYVSRILCSFLNHKGGIVYFGIDEDEQVKGIKIDRDQRDELRIAMGRLMTDNVVPCVNHARYEVRYMPVCRRAVSVAFPDSFIIEIEVFAEKDSDTLYNLRRGSDTGVYLRKEGRTIIATANDVHSLAISRQEEQCLREIQELKEDIKLFSNAKTTSTVL